MIARGFKPVGLVAGVAAAALSCYMLSLNVAAERAELAKLERSIILAKQEIRSLQTELGTRGRLQQLESWNANVLALSAPTSAQYLDNELTLARFEQPEKTMEERAVVQMASAETSQPQPQQQVKPQQQVRQPQSRVEAPVRFASAPAAPAQALVHRASLTMPEAKPVALKKAEPAAKKNAVETAAKKIAVETAPKKPEAKLAKAEPKAAKTQPKAAQAKKPALIDQKLVKSIGEAARAENSGSGGAQ